MKVYVSNYRDHWISPYTILDYLFWWTDWSKCSRSRRDWSLEEQERYVEPPEWVEKWSDRLLPISKAIQWVGQKLYPQVRYVKIDRWDTWSMDHTLAHIVLPMLHQLKRDQHGAPLVDDSDVPDHLKSINALPKENEWDTDSNHFLRWDWVMDEMIFAFESKVDDTWQDQFYSGKSDIIWKPVDADGKEVPKKDAKHYEMTRSPSDTFKIDTEGLKAYQERISNGFRLFGKYYEGLWD